LVNVLIKRLILVVLDLGHDLKKEKRAGLGDPVVRDYAA
jgi:hypothetical protein